MTELILYAYPVWALLSFINAVIRIASHAFIEPDLHVLLKGLVYLGWSIAFFGAGLLIAGAGVTVAVVEWTWIVMLPVYALTTSVEGKRFWHTLNEINKSRDERT